MYKTEDRKRDKTDLDKCYIIQVILSDFSFMFNVKIYESNHIIDSELKKSLKYCFDCYLLYIFYISYFLMLHYFKTGCYCQTVTLNVSLVLNVTKLVHLQRKDTTCEH